MTAPVLPVWTQDLITSYESGAINQFVLYGNIYDRFVFQKDNQLQIGDLKDFLLTALLPSFDVVLQYSLGNGLRVLQGQKVFGTWPGLQEHNPLPKEPLAAVDTINHYFYYCANLTALGKTGPKVACIVEDTPLIAPVVQGGLSYDVAGLVSRIRNWSTEAALISSHVVSFLLTDNINDLNPLLANNPRAARVQIPLPSEKEITEALSVLKERTAAALTPYQDKLPELAGQLIGASLGAIQDLLETRQYLKNPLSDTDVSELKKRLVEKDCNELIEFISSKRTLNDLYGMEKVKAWLRQDLALWKKGDINALPKGYLFCGPVGTGKTFLVECLAGEAGVPVVKLKNFRDKWVGSSEGNLERIFRLLHALGRCFVFIDEADQALGKRDAGTGDSGLSGRIYSMMAEEMSRVDNRGKIIWILASSRPDLIEVDLKRPGRIDVKVPLFPTLTPNESYKLLQKVAAKRGLTLPADSKGIKAKIPTMLTPGTAETIAVKAYRLAKTMPAEPVAALQEALQDYQDPFPKDVMDFQIQLAIREASDLSFVPQELRNRR